MDVLEIWNKGYGLRCRDPKYKVEKFVGDSVISGYYVFRVNGQDEGYKNGSLRDFENPDPKDLLPYESYLDGHKASGLKVGDRVRVTRRAEDCEFGWRNAWVSDMNPYIGNEHEVIEDRHEHGFALSDDLDFPYFVLEKVETPEIVAPKKTKLDYIKEGWPFTGKHVKCSEDYRLIDTFKDSEGFERVIILTKDFEGESAHCPRLEYIVFLPKQETRFVNIYRSEKGEIFTSKNTYVTREEAEKSKSENQETIEITITIPPPCTD